MRMPNMPTSAIYGAQPRVKVIVVLRMSMPHEVMPAIISHAQRADIDEQCLQDDMIDAARYRFIKSHI